MLAVKRYLPNGLFEKIGGVVQNSLLRRGEVVIYAGFDVLNRLEQVNCEGTRPDFCLLCRQSRQKEAVLRSFMKITLVHSNRIQTIKTEKMW